MRIMYSDFAQAMSAKQTDISQKQELVRKVLSRTTPYGKTMMEDVFWKNLTMAAINMKDNELLGTVYPKGRTAAGQRGGIVYGNTDGKSVMEIRKEILSLPLNSIAYLEVKEEGRGRNGVKPHQALCLDSLFRSYIREFGKTGRQQHRMAGDCGGIYQNLCGLYCKDLLPDFRKTGRRYDCTASGSMLAAWI